MARLGVLSAMSLNQPPAPRKGPTRRKTMSIEYGLKVNDFTIISVSRIWSEIIKTKGFNEDDPSQAAVLQLIAQYEQPGCIDISKRLFAITMDDDPSDERNICLRNHFRTIHWQIGDMLPDLDES